MWNLGRLIPEIITKCEENLVIEVEDLSADSIQNVSFPLGPHVSQELQPPKVRKQELRADSKEGTKIRTEQLWKSHAL